MSAASEKMRREWAVNDAKRDEGLTPPQDIVRADNLRYGGDGVWNLLDVYRPREAEGMLPVIVIVHGGGWVYGTKEIYQFYGMGLAQRGFAVVNYTYRLAPEHQFPASLKDTNLVILWMQEHAEEYGLDMQRVFMAGDSAGGHLLGLYCRFCTDASFAAAFDFQPAKGFLPRAIAMNCGAYRPIGPGGVEESSVDADLMRDLLPGGGTKEESDMIDVAGHVNANFPPAFIMTAYGDTTVGPEQGDLLEEAYRLAGASCVRKEYGDENRPLYHVFHVTVQEPAAKECNDDECAFFRGYC